MPHADGREIAGAPAVSARGLGFSWGDRTVFEGVDLEVGAAERVALIGPNGAGKTSLLRCLVGLSPARGALAVLGHSPGRAAGRAAIRRQTGYVFQRHGLVRRRTALSNVVHGMLGQPGGWRAVSHTVAPAAWREAALAALADVGLAGRAGDRADRLSGGQAQRVAIARALVARPALVIADEPTASLDPAAGEEVMALFSRLVAARGIALLFTSHDMDHARRYSDRVVALARGRVAFDLPSAEAEPARLAAVFDG